MTTINTIHDLHRILLDHPEWQSELRNILLTEELLALPKIVDQLTKNVDQLTRAVGALRENTESRFDQEGCGPRHDGSKTHATVHRK